MANEKHLLLTINGHTTGTGLEAETWQCGLRLALTFAAPFEPVATLPDYWDPVAATISRDETDWTIEGNWTVNGPLTATFAPDDWLNDQVAPALYYWMVGTKQTGNSRIDSASVYPIGAPSGHAIPAPPFSGGSPVTLSYKTPLGAGTSTGLLPLQCSMVASHRTAQTGRAGRGRMYLPPTGSSELSNGLVGATACQAIADAQAAFLEALCDLGTGVDPNLRPIVTGGNFTKGAVINSVIVDNVVDTQRRRRKSIASTEYSASTSY